MELIGSRRSAPIADCGLRIAGRWPGVAFCYSVPSNFRQLTVYQRAAVLAHELHSAVENWPLLDRRTVGPQLIRAATSVGANIAEASGRWHENDRRQLLFIARGSRYETEHWIAYCEDRGPAGHGTSERIDEIARALNGLIKKQPPS
jgi:four helix bundle protein